VPVTRRSSRSGAVAGLQRMLNMGAWEWVWLRPLTCLGILVLGGGLEQPVTAATLTPAPAVHDIDWRTSPLDLNLRGLNGERFRFQCPSGKAKAGQVVGSGPYTDGSSICAAAVHAGVIHAASGGLVTIEVRPGEAHYEASWSHFIQSERYERFWSGSFLVLAPDAADRPLSSLPGPWGRTAARAIV
jgi:LCCL domain